MTLQDLHDEVTALLLVVPPDSHVEDMEERSITGVDFDDDLRGCGAGIIIINHDED